MNDKQIISLFFDRNEDAIAMADAAYGRRLLHISQNILHCQEDAQECVSDTYLRTWNAIPPACPKSLFSYMARICRNLSLTKLNWANAAKRKAEIISLTAEMQECIPDVHRDTEISSQEMGRLLNLFLHSLSAENQMIFVQRYWFAESIASIAAKYKIKEGTLITRLHRLRKKLADFLEKEEITV